ncbi:hypothetical protein AB1K83_13515 [Sporosarcina sp. 179-K 3D1 HS]|uniref:hypothetical protein n=1 Tax=Sporosarcina sp. 179-K 3D1 HS TaxID=3232169 RepID=UPI0039A22710
MLLKNHTLNTYHRSFEKFTKTFIHVFGREDALDDLCHQEAEQLKMIAENMSGSQSRFLDALHLSVMDEERLAELEFELYSKLPDASLAPVFYLSFQNGYETSTVLLGEDFFKSLVAESPDSFVEKVLILEVVIGTLAKFKTSADLSIGLEELELLLEVESSHDNTKGKDDELMNIFDESIFATGAAKEEKIREKAFDPAVIEADEEAVQWEEGIDEEEQEETELLLVDVEGNGNAKVVDLTVFEEDDDLDWDIDFEEVEVPVEEDEESIALLNELIIDLYNRSDTESRPLIKQLRGELFELEVTSPTDEDFKEKVHQFQRELLSLELHAVEDLQIQVQMARHSLALLSTKEV